MPKKATATKTTKESGTQPESPKVRKPGELRTIPVNLIYANPYQPESRLAPADDVVKEFMDSILVHGLLQKPTVRKVVQAAPKGSPLATDIIYQVADGWMRYCAYAKLSVTHPEFAEMPVIVADITDQEMADYVLQANVIRKDLTDIDKANLFKKYIDEFHVTQAELAEREGMTQGAVGNILRLLDLPPVIQEKVSSHEISGTHARELLRLNNQPKLQAEFTERAATGTVSVAQLDLDINRRLWEGSHSLSKNSYPEPVFDLTECKGGCEFCVEIADPWGNRKKELRCTRPDCWNGKQEAATKQAAATAQEKAEKKAGADKVLTDKDVKYGQYETLVHAYGGADFRTVLDDPAQCTNCPHKALYKYGSERTYKPDTICLDPVCYRKKRTTKTRDQNKSFKEKDKALTLRIGEIASKTAKNRSGALVLAAQYLLSINLPAAVRDDLAYMFDDIPKDTKGKPDLNALRDALPTMAEPDVVKLITVLVISRLRRNEYGGANGYSIKLERQARMAVAVMENTLDAERERIIAWHKANCTGCSFVKKEMLETTEDCCDHWHQKLDDEGNCTTPKSEKPGARSVGETEEEEPEEEAGKEQVPVPEGVRLAQNVPAAECSNCGLDTQDHTEGFKFEGDVKVCIKDLRVVEKKGATPTED